MFFVPQNEQGVIFAFAQMESIHRFKLVRINTAFPDAVLERDGVTYNAEFEFRASNFLAHKHNIMKCDLVVCWDNDMKDSGFPLHIMALSEPDRLTDEIALSNSDKIEAYYWRCRAEYAEGLIRRVGIGSEVPEKIKRGESLTIDTILGVKDDPGRDKKRKWLGKCSTSKKDRMRDIILLYRIDPTMSMHKIGEKLNASHCTILRDVQKLEEEGRLVRIKEKKGMAAITKVID